MVQEEWMTVKDVAHRLKVSDETVRRWLRDRKMRGILINDRGGYRVTASEVERFIREVYGWEGS